VLIQGGYDIAFHTKAPTPMLLQVHLRPELRKRLKTPEKLRFDPPVPFHTYTDSFGNICTRLVTPRGLLKISNRFVIRDSGKPDVMPVKARQAEVEDLPDDVLVYLLGSRYCDTDKLATLAWKKFGKLRRGWPLLKAVLDYSHKRITFGYSHARADRTAFEGHEERVLTLGAMRVGTVVAAGQQRECQSAQACLDPTAETTHRDALKHKAPAGAGAWLEIIDGQPA